MRLPVVPLALVIATVAGSLILAAGGFVLGRSMADEGTPATAPVSAVESKEQPDPIVTPEPLEIPSA